MMKTNKIIKFIHKHILCKLGIHLAATIIEYRLRYKSHHVGGSFRYGTSRPTNYVQGSYTQCIYCNKKLSNFKRIKNYG